MNAIPPASRAELARVLRAFREWALHPSRRFVLEEAEIELWGLYRREQADLLRAAAAILAAIDAVEQRALLRAWREHAGECARWCAHDGYPVDERLARCVGGPVRRWPARTEVLRAEARLSADRDRGVTA